MRAALLANSSADSVPSRLSLAINFAQISHHLLLKCNSIIHSNSPDNMPFCFSRSSNKRIKAIDIFALFSTATGSEQLGSRISFLLVILKV